MTFEFIVQEGKIVGIKLDWAGQEMFAPRVDRA